MIVSEIFCRDILEISGQEDGYTVIFQPLGQKYDTNIEDTYVVVPMYHRSKGVNLYDSVN